MKKLLVLMLVMLLFMNTLIIVPAHSQNEEKTKFLFIYAPLFDLDEAYNITNVFKSFVNNTAKLSIEPIPPYNPLAQELLLLNSTWDLSKGIPLENNKILLPNGSTVAPYSMIKYETLEKIWGMLTTMFIGISSVSPKMHNRTLNPYYESEKESIPPTIFIIPLNSTIEWKLLKTKISVKKISIGYDLSIEGYVQSVKIDNKTLTTPILKLNITRKDLSINPGTYYLRFRILKVNETHAIVFTLGTRKASDWFSKYFEEFEKPVTPIIPTDKLKYMDPDDVEWVVKQVVDFYKYMVDTAYKYTAATLNIVEYPLIMQVKEAALSGYLSSDETSKLLKIVYEGLSSIINETYNKLGSNITVIIYSPYSIDKESRKITVNDLEAITDGVYKIITNTWLFAEELVSNNILFSVEKFGDSRIITIRTLHVGINTEYGYGPGELIIHGEDVEKLSKNIKLNGYNIASFLAMLSKGYGVGIDTINKYVDVLILRINDLTSQLNKAKNQINEMNTTINNLRDQLGKCNADKLNLTNKIIDLEKKIDDAKKREEQAILYATAGTISILVIVLLLSYIVTRGLKKKQ